MTVLHVVSPDVEATDTERSADIVADAAAALEGVEVEERLVEDPSVIGAIVEASADHDLTVIGATQEGLV